MVMSAEQKQAFRGRFASLDKNGDRKLDFAEWSAHQRWANPHMTDNELRVMFEGADTDGDGVIDFDEFLDFVLSHDFKGFNSSLIRPSSPHPGVATHSPHGASELNQTKMRASWRPRSQPASSHNQQGSTIMNGTGFQKSLRGSMHSNGSTFVHNAGHPLDQRGPGHIDSNVSNTLGDSSLRPSSRPSSRQHSRRRQKGARNTANGMGFQDALYPAVHGNKSIFINASDHLDFEPNIVNAPVSALARSLSWTSNHQILSPQSKSRRQPVLHGPERFFYDKSTFTGTHRFGGPAAFLKG